MIITLEKSTQALLPLADCHLHLQENIENIRCAFYLVKEQNRVRSIADSLSTLLFISYIAWVQAPLRWPRREFLHVSPSKRMSADSTKRLSAKALASLPSDSCRTEHKGSNRLLAAADARLIVPDGLADSSKRSSCPITTFMQLRFQIEVFLASV